MINSRNKISIFLILTMVVYACNSTSQEIIIPDEDGLLGETNAPLTVTLELNKSEKAAAIDGRLAFSELSHEDNKTVLIPIQIEGPYQGKQAQFTLIMPSGEKGIRKFELVETDKPLNHFLSAEQNPQNKQVIVEEINNEINKKILQYNYQTVFAHDVIRDNHEKVEEYIRHERDTFTVTNIYAVPRSNYIHPLYGLYGEMQTRDWPEGDHPHHRGIFWAWPEVYYGSEMGDIYALQTLLARPTGNLQLTSGPVFAQIIAENLWWWEDTEPIVNEKVAIRVYRSTPESRVIDLKIKLFALKDSITIATRYTDSYGGLNIRMQFPEEQNISYYTDKKDSNTKRAWSAFSGIFSGSHSASGLMVLQNQQNPDYPGEWLEYASLAWVQPTFPATGTRYALSTVDPLILSYRFIIHTGEEPEKEMAQKIWDAYHAVSAPIISFQKF